MEIKKSSIAILGTRGIPAKYGGFETFAEQLAVRLVKRGWDVTVYCESEDYPDKSATYKGIKLDYIDSPPFGPLSTLVVDAVAYWRSRKKFDLVYMLGYPASYSCFIPRLWNTPVWINMDGIEWKRSKWSWAGRVWMRLNEFLAVKMSNHIVADSRGIEAHFTEKYSPTPSMTTIAYGAHVITSADKTVLDDYDLSPGEYYTVVARLEPENHIYEIIDGFRQSNSKKKLIILGKLDNPTPYIQKLKTVSDPRIHFIGGVYEPERLEALRFYSYGYFHGHAVGGTNPSLLEAMGCGNAIIAHDNPFTRDVTDGNALFFKTAQDIPSILDRIENEEGLVTTLGAKGVERIQNVYDWDQICDQYEIAISSYLEKRR